MNTRELLNIPDGMTLEEANSKRNAAYFAMEKGKAGTLENARLRAVFSAWDAIENALIVEEMEKL
jgi:hypothetical protein